MMYGYGNGMSGCGYVLMIAGLLVLVGLGLVATGVLVVVRSGAAVRRPVSDLMRRQEAEQIIEQRFARGEVDQDEFRSSMDVLRSTVKP